MCYVRTKSTPLTAAGKLNPPPMEGVLARSLVALDVGEELPDREWTAVWGALAWDKLQQKNPALFQQRGFFY